MAAKAKSHKLRLIFVGWLVALAGVGWWQRQAIYDAWRLHSYTPPAEIVVLADHTTMNDATRRLFYVYHPALEDKDEFNHHCASTGEKTIILGCYTGDGGIYLYDVSDERLQGIEEVTAAHELLHAAYERLDPADKQEIDHLLSQAYAEVNDERIRSTIDSYKQAGADIQNELHSILGTEVRALSPALETYYKRYFKDRLAIVGFSEKYESEFTKLRTQREADEARLTSLKEQIDAKQASLQARQEALEAQAAQMDAYRRNGQIQQYNSQVAGYNAQVAAYNAEIERTKQLIDEYNQLVEEVKALISQEQTLFKAIDSNSVPSSL